MRHSKNIRQFAAAPLLLLFFEVEVAGKGPLQARIVDWLPGRTASVMTVFALIALAAYARFLRQTAKPRRDILPTPLTPPATRNTVVSKPARYPAIWLGVASLGLAAALGSYEQAVMIPIVMALVAASFFFRNQTVNWKWLALFFAILVAYLALRHQLVPSVPSKYKRQQFRFGGGVLLAFSDYLFPALSSYIAITGMLDTGWTILMSFGPINVILLFAQNITAFYQARRDWVIPTFGYLASFMAYAPMTFLKPFDHYLFWPMAMRSLLVIGFAPILGQALVSALSRPSQQAPPRPTPAPGSLPRR
jgi:hypothetical protein